MGRIHVIATLIADTHIFLWYILDPGKLAARHSRMIEETNAPIYLSMASLWEIAIKASHGKLDVPPYIADEAETNGFELLPIKSSHIECLRHMPFHHRDPFDRMLVAQALTEPAHLMSVDSQLDRYGITRV